MRLRLLVALAVFCSSVAARADGFLYKFDDTTYDWHFTYLSPSLITTNFSSITTDTCQDNGLSSTCDVHFEIDNGIYGNGIGIYFPYIGFIAHRFYGDLGPGFFTVGTHTSGGTTLVISQVPTVTPEPSSLALLGTGVLGVIGAARRRFAA